MPVLGCRSGEVCTAQRRLAECITSPHANRPGTYAKKIIVLGERSLTSMYISDRNPTRLQSLRVTLLYSFSVQWQSVRFDNRRYEVIAA